MSDASVWRAFCDRLAALGDEVLAAAPLDEAATAEGVRHLANQVACWLTYALGHTDPAHPAFFRSSDPVYQWGGPNADQVARRAPVAGDGTYRIRGSMGGCEELIVQVKLGARQSGGAGVATEVSASSLGLGPGDDIDILLSATRPAEHTGTWIELPTDASFVHLRDYYFDWQPSEPATLVIERLDTQGTAPARTDLAGVSTLLDDAAREIEHSIRFWSGYQERMLAGQDVNAFGAPAPAGGGVQEVLYSHAGVRLGADDALVVTLRHDDAPLWDVQLYDRPWYQALDFANRSTCTNHRLAHVAADGRVHVVIAGRDPGVANWLDTEGRDDVLATVRWWRPTAPPRIERTVVPLDALDTLDHLDLEPVGPEERLADLQRRAAHIAWRYRT